MDKLLKAGAVKMASTLSESKFFAAKDQIPTDVPCLNIAFSGAIDGGITPGLTVLAGPSKHFKSNLGLIGVRAYFNKYPDAVCLFYDSEFGISQDYIASHGIDTERVIHIPIEHIEMLKFDIAKRLEEIERGDHVIIFIDSVGNLASKKEVEDALEEKSAADMTRAKQMKSLFRIITPHLTMKDLPCLVVAHTYSTMELYAKQVISGGTGIMYSANTAFIISRAQEKSGTELDGYNFTINVEKSRFVREKAKIPLTVTFEGGIDKYSGMLDLAVESGMVVKPNMGWYQLVDEETGELIGKKVRQADTQQILDKVMESEKFASFIQNKYKLGMVKMMAEDQEAEDE
jgi:RecA/RadA recombinase